MMTDFKLPQLEYVRTIRLKHTGDCKLIGVTSDLQIYAEEIYTDDCWLAQHHVGADGEIITSIDEDHGNVSVTEPLPVPTEMAQPSSGWQTMWLNFAGPRHRGLRALERVDALVRSMTIQDKMALSAYFKFNMPPPMLLGLAESYVISEAKTPITGLYFVCRRLRIAFVLPAPQTDEQGEPYDYDTRVIYGAHFAIRSAESESLLSEIDNLFPGVTPIRPMDCVITANHLIIADGGDTDRLSAVHLWRFNPELKALNDQERAIKRIYG